MNIRMYGMVEDSIVDGPGLRFGVFVQGCSHACPGCHNPESHNPSGGTEYTVTQVLEKIAANPLVNGVTLSGGEPFEQAAACAEIAVACKDRGLNVWAYTGYLYEDLRRIADSAAPDAANAAATNGIDLPPEDAIYSQAHAKRGNTAALDPQGVAQLLDTIDALIDGPYVEKLHSYQLKWRGSSNQRIIDLAATRRTGKLVEWKPPTYVPTKPASW